MLTIAICDDNEKERNMVKELSQEFSSQKDYRIKCEVFQTGSDLLSFPRLFDIYLLDVLMPGKNGIDLALALREKTEQAVIIFLTSSPDHAVESYRARAFYYLMKPIRKEIFYPVLQEAAKSARNSKTQPIMVKTASGTVLLSAGDVLYAELFRRRVRYVCKGETVLSKTSTASFKEMTKDLRKKCGFYACGASLIISLRQVKMVGREEAVFFSGAVLSIPRLSYHPLLEAWTAYWLEV